MISVDSQKILRRFAGNLREMSDRLGALKVPMPFFSPPPAVRAHRAAARGRERPLPVREGARLISTRTKKKKKCFSFNTPPEMAPRGRLEEENLKSALTSVRGGTIWRCLRGSAAATLNHTYPNSSAEIVRCSSWWGLAPSRCRRRSLLAALLRRICGLLAAPRVSGYGGLSHCNLCYLLKMLDPPAHFPGGGVGLLLSPFCVGQEDALLS